MFNFFLLPSILNVLSKLRANNPKCAYYINRIVEDYDINIVAYFHS